MFIDDIVNRRSSVLLIWLTIAGAAVLIYLLEPGKSAFLPACPFRTLTGYQCPGCGSTRGLHQLVHGNLSGAFQLNPLLILSLPFLMYPLLRYTYSVISGKPVKTRMLPVKYIWLIFGIVVFFWVFRNTPFYPFVS